MPKLSKITVACTKTGQFWEKSQFWLTQSQQNDCKFWTVESQQNDQFGNLYISSHGEARNIKFVQHVNPIQKVPLGTRPQELVMSLPHNHVTLTNLFISSYRDYYYQIWSVKTFFSIWVFFHGHSWFKGQQWKGKAISLSPLHHFYQLHRHLGISRVITAGSLALHIASRMKPGTFGFWENVANH